MLIQLTENANTVMTLKDAYIVYHQTHQSVFNVMLVSYTKENVLTHAQMEPIMMKLLKHANHVKLIVLYVLQLLSVLNASVDGYFSMKTVLKHAQSPMFKLEIDASNAVTDVKLATLQIKKTVLPAYLHMFNMDINALTVAQLELIELSMIKEDQFVLTVTQDVLPALALMFVLLVTKPSFYMNINVLMTAQ
eukprot:TRINITY_DN1005_c0_g1_i1.p2 TRINITY_DN1005_c0_g1~~TRINITY_DN1005_c0_g1_i1.p2  ORF type:complete len:192 (-),score=21.18 TRINITY_DN1005_c0_g1_i1:4509-5084(-)